MLDRSWLEVDLDILENNYKLIKKAVYDNQKIMAVVKANAYGFGGVEIAKTLQNCGCEKFAVSNLQEGIELRQNGVKGQILILGYTPPRFLYKVVENDLIQTVISSSCAQELFRFGKCIKTAVAIDTGMNRLGLKTDKDSEIVSLIYKCYEKTTLISCFSHLAIADEKKGEEFTKEQTQKLKDIKNKIPFKEVHFHIANTALSLKNNDEDFGVVRVGIGLYGLAPSGWINLPKGVKQVAKWKTVISLIKEIKRGESVGYGRSFVAEKDMKIGVLPTGYADGYRRILSNRGKVFINGSEAKVVGRICMDQMMVDLSNLTNPKVGDEVTLIGDKYSFNEMAKDLKTINYEVGCSRSNRVKRIYIKNGKTFQ